MKKLLLSVIALCLLCLAVALPAAAATTSVTLAWDAVPEATGYRVYHAAVAGGPYTLAGDAGAALTFTHSALADGNHCWVATAYDASANESGYSNEVCSVLDANAPAAPQNLRVTITVRVE